MCIGLFSFLTLYKTNRFHVAVGLFSNRSQRTSKCGITISDTIRTSVTHSPAALCFYHILTSSVACEQQTYFRSSLRDLSLRKIVLPLRFAYAVFRRERSDDRKCVCCWQATSSVIYSVTEQTHGNMESIC